MICCIVSSHWSIFIGIILGYCADECNVVRRKCHNNNCLIHFLVTNKEKHGFAIWQKKCIRLFAWEVVILSEQTQSYLNYFKYKGIAPTYDPWLNFFKCQRIKGQFVTTFRTGTDFLKNIRWATLYCC